MSAGAGKARRALKQAAERLQAAVRAVDAAAAGKIEGEPGTSQAELSAETAASIKHYLGLALAEDRAAGARGLAQAKRSARLKAAHAAKRASRTDLRTARALAKQVP